MFLKGKIKSFSTSRGFGFIEVEGDIDDVFFHIKDLPQNNIEPKIGEALQFMIVEDQGKFKAGNIQRLGLSSESKKTVSSNKKKVRSQASPRYQEAGHKTTLITVIGIIIVAVLGFLTYGKYQSYSAEKQRKAEQLMLEQQQIVEEQRKALGQLPDQVLTEQGKQNLDAELHQTNQPRSERVTQSIDKQNGRLPVSTGKFKCDGRTHCSQMRSYEEALYFLRNCPNTKMDGNNDGEPCERQFGK
ncbi:DNA-binding protein [Acinetobacter sp. WCHA55]|uniref:cold shock domain-containing protein n=1 Tax=Acinetobacter sp. WCHA55 TaxID=2004646 RepID=UPI000B3D1B51|nr:cold shock domain-containing protein [Acinetobacter sp. WCHA55]AYA68027.1 DNA-binding protein [Acinetobacter sp. WCHA55]